MDRIIEEMDSSNAPHPTPQMCHLLILGEDRRFHYHLGVDCIGICRAIWKTVFCGQVQGGSTIAMQLVRTLTGHYERTCRRKLREMVLAVRMTSYVGRDRLPSLYLWIAHYGWEMNGFNRACMGLGIDPISATPLETARLIARLKYPEPRQFDCMQSQRIERRARYLISLRRRHVTDPRVSAIVLSKLPIMASLQHTRRRKVELRRSSPSSV